MWKRRREGKKNGEKNEKRKMGAQKRRDRVGCPMM